MTKKTKKLTEVQFYKWRLAIEKMKLSDKQKELVVTQMKVKELEVQNLTLRANIFRGSIHQSNEECNLFKHEYDKLKEELEGEIGFSLNNKVIDEITFDIKDIEA